MSHFLFRPHVVGPENNITTPDVLIDRANVVTEHDQVPLPVHRLHTMNELRAQLRDIVLNAGVRHDRLRRRYFARFGGNRSTGWLADERRRLYSFENKLATAQRRN